MASTAFRSVTPLVPRINGADYIAFPLDGNVSGAEGNDCQYAMTVIAEGEPGTVTSNPSLVEVDSGETEVYQVPCNESYEFLASGTAEFYKDDVLVATGVTADIAIDADSEIKIVFLYNPE